MGQPIRLSQGHSWLAVTNRVIELAFRVAVASRAMTQRHLTPILLLTCVLFLSACGSVLTASTADLAGVAGAGVAGAVTKSPAGAAAIGLGVASAANGGLQIVERNVHGREQDQIAAAAGALQTNEVGQWKVTHTIPIENDEHGEVVVVRLIGSADFDCKDIIFSVDTIDQKEGVRKAFYTATVCKDGTQWKWASAEPATSRWGALQ